MRRNRDAAALASGVLAGDRIAAARLITLAENRAPGAKEAMKRLHPHTGRAHVLGITGPPGSGKSTLTDRLIAHYRAKGLKVGVIAVDPSSPFTGGAILGDRVRMSGHFTDPEVFIRSMGARGALGGLSLATQDTVRILDALGKDVIIIETVGVGQGEVDIVKTADTVVVVEVPGLGDEIQNIKAGIMEIGDLFVVNKADRDGADRTIAELEVWIAFGHGHPGENPEKWVPPVLATIAGSKREDDGIAAFGATILEHREWLESQGGLHEKRVNRGRNEILDILRQKATEHVLANAKVKEHFDVLAKKVAARETDPYTAAEGLFGDWVGE